MARGVGLITGKTHMAISTATAATALYATGVRATGSMGYLLPSDTVERGSGPYAIAGLLLLGLMAGLFPDLDAQDTELQHLPRKAASYLGRYATAGMRGHSPLTRLIRALVQLAALPFTLVVGAVGVAIRASTSHRGFTHTLLGALVFTGLVTGATLLITGSMQWTLAVGTVWLLGYSSHLAADACTPSGIPLLGVSGKRVRASASRTSVTSVTSVTSIHPSRYAGSNSWNKSHHSSDVPPHNAMRCPGVHMFHLLPRGMRVGTGTIADTLFIRWTAWAICAVAVALTLLA